VSEAARRFIGRCLRPPAARPATKTRRRGAARPFAKSRSYRLQQRYQQAVVCARAFRRRSQPSPFRQDLPSSLQVRGRSLGTDWHLHDCSARRPAKSLPPSLAFFTHAASSSSHTATALLHCTPAPPHLPPRPSRPPTGPYLPRPKSPLPGFFKASRSPRPPTTPSAALLTNPAGVLGAIRSGAWRGLRSRVVIVAVLEPPKLFPPFSPQPARTVPVDT
jgi:hypothetical protein